MPLMQAQLAVLWSEPMNTLWVLVLWFGVNTSNGATGGIDHITGFTTNQECLDALTVIHFGEGGFLIHGICVPITEDDAK